MSETRPAIAEIVDLLSKKWVMRIIWELRDGAMTFRELQEACESVSPTTLNQRLKLLRTALLVQNEKDQGYHLTDLGYDLLVVYRPLGAWAERWQEQTQKKTT